jgi:SAM-dependent methyltransferase
MPETIEILPVSLLDEDRQTLTALKKLASSLSLEFGWHYLLDLTWIIQRLGNVGGKFILDAGAGTGVLQWFLAEQGAQVLSVDRASRADLPLRFRKRFQVEGLRDGDLAPTAQVIRHNLGDTKKFAAQARDLVNQATSRRSPGRVVIYQQDLKTLADVATDSQDAVVAVSALEHNPPQELGKVRAELLRVLKPGGILLATLGAARDQDWFHAPSQGWCYTESSLRRYFELPNAPSNYSQYDVLFAALRNCSELREGLASFYFRSGDNGMPWGKWDPQYPPVGVCKSKPVGGAA